MKLANPQGVTAGFAVLQPLAAVPELTKVGEQWSIPEFMTGVHVHSEWEFHLQLAGKCVWTGQDLGHAYQMSAPNLIAVAPGLYHRMASFQSNQHYFFTGIDLNKVFKRHPRLKTFWAKQRVVFIPNGEEIVAPFQNLVHEVAKDHCLRSTGLRLAMDYFILRITRLLNKQPSKNVLTHWHPAIVQARELIENQPAINWSIPKLAQQCNLSASHLSEKFLKHVGMTPHQYLLICRVERAKEMLRQTNLPITSLALELGFSSSQHFAAVFHRLTGHNARDYRQKKA
ncbi:MAG: AraC family transcriptional regulator [Verrucomicrobiae bacterium]|nr:AraC family transcriptional regulator [Verrucomicrobiae bacterium]